jgi:hypothetical protein
MRGRTEGGKIVGLEEKQGRPVDGLLAHGRLQLLGIALLVRQQHDALQPLCHILASPLCHLPQPLPLSLLATLSPLRAVHQLYAAELNFTSLFRIGSFFFVFF